ncbi:ZIP family metal transporter [Peredibacter sp. HCB2-198]|uniref:ZIP family metal transporter n=1 Tax=Peredibacter sp. HCB2-198 TaxID=3383025 RepID=UPI0038B48F7F
MGQWIVAGFWGWLAGSALLIGACMGYFIELPQKVISAVMAFGSGVLISAICFELMDKGVQGGHFLYPSIGFLGGAIIYTMAAKMVNSRGGKHRKRSHDLQPREEEDGGSGTAIAIGALLDGIPESIVIGLTILSGGSVSLVAVFAIFLSNLPEGISSSSGMKKAGRSKKYVFSLWLGIALISGIASIAGYTLFGHLGDNVIGLIMCLAAGAMLAMIVTTMIPEAYEEDRDWSGIITVLGFLVSFMASHLD